MKEASSYDPPPFMVDPDKIRVHRAVLRHKESVRRISEPFKHKICYVTLTTTRNDGQHIPARMFFHKNAQPVLCRILCRRICGTCTLAAASLPSHRLRLHAAAFVSAALFRPMPRCSPAPPVPGASAMMFFPCRRPDVLVSNVSGGRKSLAGSCGSGSRVRLGAYITQHTQKFAHNFRSTRNSDQKWPVIST